MLRVINKFGGQLLIDLTSRVRFTMVVCLIAASVGLLFYPSHAHAQLPTRVQLPVPWVIQLLPGADWANTKTCGQASAEMCSAYFAHRQASQSQIWAVCHWLALRFNDWRYTATPNSWYTNFTGRNELGAILNEYYHLHFAPMSALNLTSLKQQVAAGRPVIAEVMIHSGTLVSSGGVPHWVVVTGYDVRLGVVYVNDPGSSSGNQRPYSIATFDASWARQGRIMVPVNP